MTDTIDFNKLRVHVEIGGVTHVWSVPESYEVIGRIRAAQDALKVKCPTCRCRIYPDTTCECCASCFEDDEPLI